MRACFSECIALFMNLYVTDFDVWKISGPTEDVFFWKILYLLFLRIWRIIDLEKFSPSLGYHRIGEYQV